MGDYAITTAYDSDGNVITSLDINNNDITNSYRIGFNSTTLSVGWDTDNTVAIIIIRLVPEDLKLIIGEYMVHLQ